MHFKTLPGLLFGICLCFSLNSLLAQPPQFQGQLNTMRFNNEMRMQNQMLNMRGLTGTADLEFVVLLRDSTRLQLTSAMYRDSVTGKRFVVFIDKKFGKKDTNRYKKIFPSQTARIIRNVSWPGDYMHDPLNQGMPNDTCWMFRVITGPITVYSYLSHKDIAGNPDPADVTGIQLNNGTIVKFSGDDLKKMIASDSTAMEYFGKKKYIKAIKKFNQNAVQATN